MGVVDPRPAHRQPLLVLLVASTGALGALSRAGLGELWPPVAGWPMATLAANLTGALALGLVLEACSRFGPTHRVAVRVRLAVGTGFLGGYTTFSALALETERLLASGAIGQAVGYVLGTMLGGVMLAWLGIRLGRMLPLRAPGDVSEGPR
ncbi:CrcB family protein [Cellulomonas sp. NPDC089187]|uniref:fluoride efflux transporter FluC n=1 Tax=Cellulomonas sp. NPDC089187 TaxID=3154970 RepID=UPI00342A2FEC